MSSYRNLSIDLETYSPINLKKSGVACYVEHPDFAILLIGYSFDDEEAKVVDLACGELPPQEFIDALTDENITKWAFNTQFERYCLSKYLGLPVGTYLSPRQWKDTMIWASVMGINLSLKGVGEVLELENRKMEEGATLIRYFTVPCLPTKSNYHRTRNLPEHNPGKWATFKEYNRIDVVVEKSIQRALANHPVPDFIWEEFWLSEEINDRGVLIDVDLARSAIAIDEAVSKELMEKMKLMTSLDNPNSVSQLKEWLERNGIIIDSLGKKSLLELKKTINEQNIVEVLKLREMTSKTSIKKYQAMLDCINFDNRARGLFAFASCKTLRWSSKRIQLQNMKRNDLTDLDGARGLVKKGDITALSMLYDNVPDVLSQLIRTALIPKPGYKFVVADFSSIEARVLAYLSHEGWRLFAFEKGMDIYCASASKMFKRKVEKHDPARQRGKVAELALGYSGGVAALKAMGALEMGIEEKELKGIVNSWREASPSIVKFWKDVGRAAIYAVKHGATTSVENIIFRYKGQILYIELPSGHFIAYIKPRIELDQYGREIIMYKGVNMAKKWGDIEIYDGKIVENIVQCYARNVLAFAMKNLSQKYDIVAHIHDEVIIECPLDTKVEDVCNLMSISPSWASDLPLKAEGYETFFYKKE